LRPATLMSPTKWSGLFLSSEKFVRPEMQQMQFRIHCGVDYSFGHAGLIEKNAHRQKSLE